MVERWRPAWSVAGGIGGLVAAVIASSCALGAPRLGSGTVASGDSPHAPVQGPRLPLSFEPNEGQFDEAVRFVARAAGFTVFLTDAEAVVRLGGRSPSGVAVPSSVLGLRWAGAKAVVPSGGDRRAGVVNYLLGNRRPDWLTGIPTYGRVHYSAVYDGVDVDYHSREGVFEYDVVVAPGADPTRVALEVSGAAALSVDDRGDLRIETAAGPILMRAPVAYQDDETARTRVVSRYVLDGRNRVRFELGDYDPHRELVIDPQLLMSTFLGGTGNGLDQAYAVALDATGAPYIVGSTETTDFPTQGPFQAMRSGPSDAFVTKLSPDGTQLVYSTYLGGTGFDYGTDIAVSPDGIAYVIGDTTSGDFPLASPFQAMYGGNTDAFVVRLNASGTAVTHGTFLGGSATEQAHTIAFGRGRLQGQLIVAGTTASTNFPQVNNADPRGAGRDPFVAAFMPDTLAVMYSSYGGGAGDERATGLAMNPRTGHIYVTMETAASPSSIRPGLLSIPQGGPIVLQELIDFSADAIDPWRWHPKEGILDGFAGSALSTPLSDGDLVGPIQAPPGGGGSGAGAVIRPEGVGSPIPQSAALAPNDLRRAALAMTATGCIPVAPAVTCNERAVVLFWDDNLQLIGHINFGGQRRGRAFTITASEFDLEGRLHVIGTTSDDALAVVNPVQANYAGSSEGFVLTLDPTTGQTTFLTYLGGSSFETLGDLAVDGLGNAWVVGSTQSANFPSTGNAPQSTLRGRIDAFATRINITAPTDSDGDGLPSSWEAALGLDPTSATATNGANGDPDGDGRTNATELLDGTHPRGLYTRYLSEGATGSFFDLQLAIVNPGATTAHTLLRFLRGDGVTVSHLLTLAPGRRATLAAESIPGLENAEFSTVLESDATVALDRTMTWDANGYGSHAETGIPSPSLTWYLAEGSTTGGFALFYLLQNPSLTTAADVTVRFLLPTGAPLERTYTVAPKSRFNIWVNEVTFPGLGKALAATDVSAAITVTNNVGIIAERAMYLTGAGQLFRAGHESAGVTAPAMSWFMAEGATGPFFDLFILLANPNPSTAQVHATYLLESGNTVVKNYSVPGNSRFNVWVDFEDAALANAAVSTTLVSTNGVSFIAERAMWWPGTSATWHEAHNSPGTTQTGTQWALAEGEVGGTRSTTTYILIANTSPTAGSVRVRLLFENGTFEERVFAVAANSRFNIDVASAFAQSPGRRFGAILTSEGSPAAQIVVERAMYSDAGGVIWAAGTNALATRLQ